MSDYKIKPIIDIIHERNHTHTQRVGSLASVHSNDPQIISDLDGYYSGVQYTNLNPGVYRLDIDGNTCVIDVYDTMFGTDYLQIDNSYKAFMQVGIEKRYMPLYILLDEHDQSESYTVKDTINNWFDMLIIDGHSEYNDKYGYGSPALDSPINIVSISSLTWESTSDDNKSEELTMNLKDFIKSLPDGTKDICVINAQQQKFHIINRIGRTTFSGYDAWRELENWSTDTWGYFFCNNDNVPLQNANDNLRCTHLPCEYYTNIAGSDMNCIATCNDSEIGHGFVMKVKTDLLKYGDNPTKDHLYCFQKWLYNIFMSNTPMTVEYPLIEINYKNILLDEYHLSTYFNATNFRLTNVDDCDVSYFYKII